MTVICRPSATYIWANCAAAPSFMERVPVEPDSDPAREGTCAAWVAEVVINGHRGKCIELLGATHDNGWLVDIEMVNHVQNYVDIVLDGSGVSRAEQPVQLSPYIQGTYDASTTVRQSSLLRVGDLKYGQIIVEVFECLQLIIYAAAELKRLGFPSWITDVEMFIYQPRPYHYMGPYRPWTISVNDLWSYAQDLINKAEACQVPNPVATPGNHCQYCKAKVGCEANAHSVYSAAWHATTSTHHRTLSSLELKNDADLLKTLKRLITDRENAVHAEMEQRMSHGEYFPGWFQKPRKGHRKFKPFVTPDTLFAMTGINGSRVEPLTPPEMEKLGASPKVINALSFSPDIGHKLDQVPANYFDNVFKGKPR